MWVVVEIGKKQYIVNKGDSLKVNRLKQTEGEIVFDKVLLLAAADSVQVGSPYLEKVQVKAAGGVRTLDAILPVIDVGCTRVGATATAVILDEFERRGGTGQVKAADFPADTSGY